MSNATVNLANLPPDKRATLEKWLIQRAGHKPTVSTPSVNGASMPLSLAQESLWFFDQLVPNSPLYNIPEAFRLRGPLDVTSLEQAFRGVFARHDALRVRVHVVDGKPMQVVSPDKSFELPVVDLSSLPEAQREKEAAILISDEAKRPFDLSTGPMLRAQLIRLNAVEHVLILNVHHIVADHSSILLLHEEVAALYERLSSGKSCDLPQLPAQFPEFAACQRARLSSSASQKDRDYWTTELAGELPVLEIPTDFPRPATQTFNGSRRKINFPASLLQALRDFSRKENSSLYITLLAAFEVLLHRYSQQDDFIIGAPVSARTQSDAEKLIGYFINILPIRARISSDAAFVDFLKSTRQNVFNALAHQDVSIEQLVEQLRVPRQPGRNPLFQAVFQLLQTGMPSLNLPGVKCEVLDVETGTAKFDLTLTLSESEHGLGGDIEYNTDLFHAETIDRMVGHFGALLQSIVANPETPVSSLAVLTAKESAQLRSWNQTATDYPKDATIAELFTSQVNATPDAVAVVSGERKLTYRELNARSNQLAHYLRKLGVGPDVMVGICIERSVEMIVGLLGILKAGGAYVTLDASYPKERLAYMFEDTGASVFVTNSKFRDIAPAQTKIVSLDEDAAVFYGGDPGEPKCRANGDSIAYVIYTSGSTGKPKAVLIPNRGVVRLVKQTNYLRFSHDDIFLQFAPISFDASTLEIWGPLLNGGQMVMFPAHFDSLKQLADVIRGQGITTLWLTSGLFHQMVEEHIDALRGVKQLLSGGDVLSPSHVLKALKELPDTQIINGYGPTENTTFTCCYPVPCDWAGQRSVPIGKPISNTTVYILDAKQQQVPIGVPGELYIGGAGLARCYLNAPELNLTKFVCVRGETLYRTGDLVRWLTDGNIEFLGRIDNQVKIRGFRIELAEIEAVLGQIDAVQQAAVVARQDGAAPKRLVAYVVLKPGTSQSITELRTFLESKLPGYMVPSSFVLLDQLPLTTNGKVDRRRLPAPDEASPVASDCVAPRTETEGKLAQIWKEVLGVAQVGVEDNFFELGGHSLLATRIISRIHGTFGKDVPMRAIFEAPTIAKLAQAVDAASGGGMVENSPIIRRRRRAESLNPSASGAS